MSLHEGWSEHIKLGFIYVIHDSGLTVLCLTVNDKRNHQYVMTFENEHSYTTGCECGR